jgi:hypothetical protein
MSDYVDSMTRYKLQREFKKAQKKSIKEMKPKVGDKAARRLVKVASRTFQERMIRENDNDSNGNSTSEQ